MGAMVPADCTHFSKLFHIFGSATAKLLAWDEFSCKAHPRFGDLPVVATFNSFHP